MKSVIQAKKVLELFGIPKKFPNFEASEILLITFEKKWFNDAKKYFKAKTAGPFG